MLKDQLFWMRIMIVAVYVVCATPIIIYQHMIWRLGAATDCTVVLYKESVDDPKIKYVVEISVEETNPKGVAKTNEFALLVDYADNSIEDVRRKYAVDAVLGCFTNKNTNVMYYNSNPEVFNALLVDHILMMVVFFTFCMFTLLLTTLRRYSTDDLREFWTNHYNRSIFDLQQRAYDDRFGFLQETELTEARLESPPKPSSILHD